MNAVGTISPGTEAESISDDRAWILSEVERGLPNARGRISEATENQAFYDFDGCRYLQKREAESERDFANRPKREAGFTQQAVRRLCEHSYSPGPQRKIQGDGLADSLLQQVYEENHIDAVMSECDRLATLNDVAAIQIEATNKPEKPIDLRIWGANEFEVFLSPSDPREPVCVVTIDRFNGQTRYRAWFADTVATYVTQPYSPDRTAGARVAFPRGEQRHTYGTIPFAFLHHHAPVRQFWTPGPGSFLRRAEFLVNGQLSELAESIQRYQRPLGVFKNVDPKYNPVIKPGEFIRLMSGGSSYDGEGYAGDGEPSVEYLQATLAIADVWEDLSRYLKQVSAATDLPFSALELDYQDAPSGISLIIRSAPLITRAKSRRAIYQAAESELAKAVLTCAGNHYGHPELVEQAKAVRLLLSWADPRIPVPGPERDQADEWEMQTGIKSRVMVVMERYGLSRDQALEHLAQVAADNEEAEAIAPMEEETPEEETGENEGEPTEQPAE